jgi:hypothetical protein
MNQWDLQESEEIQCKETVALERAIFQGHSEWCNNKALAGEDSEGRVGCELTLHLPHIPKGSNLLSHRIETLKSSRLWLGFGVLTAVKAAIVWEVTPWGLVDTFHRVRGICCLHLQDNICIYSSALQMKAAGSSEMLLHIYQTTRCHMSEDRNLDTLVRNTKLKHRKFLPIIICICSVRSEIFKSRESW